MCVALRPATSARALQRLQKQPGGHPRPSRTLENGATCLRAQTPQTDTKGTILARLCSPAIGGARKNESGPGFVGERGGAANPRQRVIDFIGRFGACK